MGEDYCNLSPTAIFGLLYTEIYTFRIFRNSVNRRQERSFSIRVWLSHGCVETVVFLYVTPFSLVEICRRFQKSCGIQHRNRCIHLPHSKHGREIWTAWQYL